MHPTLPGGKTGSAQRRSRARRASMALLVLAAGLVPALVPSPAGAAAPAAPTLVAPANGASVTVPFTIDWSAVSHPSGIAGYNWQVSTSSTFSTVVLADSTAGDVTEAKVAGLTNGTYFWRVQTATNSFEQSAWSGSRSVTVTGPGPGQIAAPTLAAPFPAQVHPFESIHFSWTAVAGAATYVLEASKSSTFPSASTIKVDNITGTKTSLVIGDFCNGCEQGTYFVRVYAIGTDGTRGLASNTRTFGVSYNAPLPPPPNLLAPANGTTLTLPFFLDWSDVPNPQDSGYEVQVSKNSSFTNIENPLPGRTASNVKVLSLTAGKKWWRVRSAQGNASPTTAAVTAWSAVRTFTIPSGPAAVQSVWLGAPPCEDPCPGADTLVSGQEINASIQLTTPAPAGGAVVRLRADNAAAGTFPASVTIPAGQAFDGFRLIAGNVSAPTQVTLTATLGPSSDTFVFTVSPTSVKQLDVSSPWTGGVQASAFVTLGGAAPPGGAVISLSSSSTLARPPATFKIQEGFWGGSVAFPTSAVTSHRTVTISATYRGSTVSAPLTLTPQVAPTSLTLDRTSAAFQEGASGTVRIAAVQDHDVHIRLSSSHPAYASVPQYVTIPAGVTAGGFFVNTQPPPSPTKVTITARGAGVAKRATLTVTGF